MHGFRVATLHIHPQTGEVVCEGDQTVRLWVAKAKQLVNHLPISEAVELRAFLRAAARVDARG